MPHTISPELYRRHRDQVLAMTNARQRYEPGEANSQRGLTDREIAEVLGVTPGEVTEIRCVAELESVELDRYFEADDWKEGRFGTQL